jgi:hypothetical protein
LLGGGPTLIYDGFGLNPPTLVAASGAAVTITTDMAVDTVRVWVGEAALPVTATGERTYAATLPAGLTLPTRLEVDLDATTATHRLTSGWTLVLAAPPPDPVPVPVVVLGPVAEPVAAPRISAPVRLDGRRLAVTLTCATRCTGTLTLKTPSLRVARIAYRAAGTQRVTIRAAVLRHLERRGIRRLRAVLTPTGGRPIVTSLRLART